MKKLITLTLITTILSISIVNASPNVLYNPHSNIHKLDKKSINKNVWLGNNYKFLVSCSEYKYWTGSDTCPEEPIKAETTHRKRNQEVIDTVNFYAERMLNIDKYSLVGVIALYNEMAEDLYPDSRSVISYPWDLRQEGYMGLVTEDEWDWREIEYVLNFRTGLHKYEDTNYEEWRKKLDSLLLKNMVSIPMWTNPSPYMRQNPILPNNMSTRKDFTYSRNTNKPMWVFGDTYSKWYIPDIFNSLIGELDIRYGSENLTLVDQKYIKRHNNRNTKDFIKQYNISDYRTNMLKCFEYQKKFGINRYDEPRLFSDLSEIMTLIESFVDGTDYAKFTNQGFTDFIERCIKPLVRMKDESATRLYNEMSTLYWWYTYYVTSRYIA